MARGARRPAVLLAAASFALFVSSAVLFGLGVAADWTRPLSQFVFPALFLVAFALVLLPARHGSTSTAKQPRLYLRGDVPPDP